MLPDQVLNPGPMTYESGALPIALRGPAKTWQKKIEVCSYTLNCARSSLVSKKEKNLNKLLFFTTCCLLLIGQIR